jgi:hypothetical protein
MARRSARLEDWYFVDDFAALGALNEAAISGPRAAVHAAFRTKPSGVTYSEYSRTMPDGVQVWQRKMVLGASPEFCVLSDHPLEDSMPGEPLYPRV